MYHLVKVMEIISRKEIKTVVTMEKMTTLIYKDKESFSKSLSSCQFDIKNNNKINRDSSNNLEEDEVNNEKMMNQESSSKSISSCQVYVNNSNKSNNDSNDDLEEEKINKGKMINKESSSKSVSFCQGNVNNRENLYRFSNNVGK